MTGCWPQLDQCVWSGVAAKTLASVKRPDAGSLYDRTLAGCVRSVLTYADVGRIEETLCHRTLAVPVKHDRTRPVRKNRVWNLTGNDRTLRSSVRLLSY